MPRYATTVESRLPPEQAFAYMADFRNAREWDPSVSSAEQAGDGPLGTGTAFELVARFGGSDVPLRYVVCAYEPPRRVVLEAQRPGFVSRDTITVEAVGDESRVTYDATLALHGLRRLLAPLMQLLFTRIGRDASAGMQAALNR